MPLEPCLQQRAGHSWSLARSVREPRQLTFHQLRAVAQADRGLEYPTRHHSTLHLIRKSRANSPNPTIEGKGNRGLTRLPKILNLLRRLRELPAQPQPSRTNDWRSYFKPLLALHQSTVQSRRFDRLEWVFVARPRQRLGLRQQCVPRRSKGARK